MEVLEMFLKDMGIDSEVIEKDGMWSAESSAFDFDELINRVSQNSYYYNNSILDRNRITITLNGQHLGVWCRYRIEVLRLDNFTRYNCYVVGYQTVLSGGSVALMDSLTSKSKFEV